MRISLKSMLFASSLAVMPVGAVAEITELSQGQMRQLVAQEQVLSASTIATDAVSEFGGAVVDIRGFLSDGRMTYRLLLQRDDGWVVELLYNGPDGRRVSHTSAVGQAVSSEAVAANGPSNLPGNANANARNNANAGNNGKANGRDNRGSNSGRDSGRGNSGNSGNNGRGNGRGN